VIQLPLIHNLQLQVIFTTAERQRYKDVRLQVLSQLNDPVPAFFKSLHLNFFINIFFRRFSMICNLGLHFYLRHEKPSFKESPDDWQSESQKAFNLRREEGVIQCQLCGLRLDEMESLIDEGVQKGKPWFSRCLTFLCPVCCQSESNRQNFCPQPTCCIAAATTDPSVVFSSWRTTLNVIQAGLDHESIPCLRFDGTIMQKEKHNVIGRFRDDPQIRLLLLTLTCGAIGLAIYGSLCATRYTNVPVNRFT
jgi:SNF2 family DNA or RNA helicase